jgi:hypothetical protein
VQQVCLRSDAFGEIVFLYSGFRVRKRTKEKLGWVSQGIGSIPNPCGETVGAAGLFYLRRLRRRPNKKATRKNTDGSVGSLICSAECPTPPTFVEHRRVG